MKFTRNALLLASVSLLGACSVLKPSEDDPTYRVGPHYTAKGYVAGVSAYLYGDRTILRYKRKPLFLSIRDANGAPVGYTEIGDFYRLDRQVDSFRARANLALATDFKLATSSRAPGNPGALKAPAASSPAPLAGTAPTAPQITKPQAQAPAVLADARREAITLLLDYSQRQLEEVKAAIEQGATDRQTLDALSAKLDRIEALIRGHKSALFIGYFKPYETAFTPESEIAEALALVARLADRITVRGRTDSNRAGEVDKRLARARAESARSFLVEQGIAPEKITAVSLGAGDHIAPNTNQRGRDLNRRVEVEIELSPLALAAAQPPKAAEPPQLVRIQTRPGSLYENLVELSQAHGWNPPQWDIGADWHLSQAREFQCLGFAQCVAALLRSYPVDAKVDQDERLIHVIRERT